MFDFQFPYFLTDEINRKINQGIRGRTVNEKEILNRVKEFAASNQRLNMIVGENYYIGKHDILRRKRTAIGEDGKTVVIENLPNNTIVDNQYKKLVDQKVNYIVGKPVTFKSNDRRYSKLVKNILDSEFSRSIKNVTRDALNCGIGWLFVNYDSSGKLIFKRIKPWELVAVWQDDEHTLLDYAIRFYDVKVTKGRREETVRKIEIFEKKGISRYYVDRGGLVNDGKDWFSPYFFTQNGGGDWNNIPLIAFKCNENERPLIKNVKSLQDGLNVLISNFQNSMEEDVRNTILVLKNYDGENLGEFRRNLATFGAVKVRTVDGSQGGVDTLNIQVNCENYKAIIELFKKAIIENAMGYDAKDDRLMGQPNQMNIISMYSDIDLDTNGIETEFQRAFKCLFYFIDFHFANKGLGIFYDKEKEVIFNRDVLINESELIDNCIKSMNILSEESVIAKHPWVENLESELKKIKKQRELETMKNNDNQDEDLSQARHKKADGNPDEEKPRKKA